MTFPDTQRFPTPTSTAELEHELRMRSKEDGKAWVANVVFGKVFWKSARNPSSVDIGFAEDRLAMERGIAWHGKFVPWTRGQQVRVQNQGFTADR